MDFPPEIRRVVGYYAVASLADAQVLHRGGIIPLHSQSLSCVSMEFGDVDNAMRAMGALLFSGVRKLKLDRVSSDASLQRLADLAPHLEELDLGQCRGLEHTLSLCDFPKLHTLTINECPCVTGKFLSTLRKLSLNGCGLHVSAMDALTSLELKGCAVTAALPLSSEMEHLTLRNNWFGPDQADWGQVMKLEQWMNLKTLDVTALTNFDNARVAAIGLMKNLESLTLNGCPQVTDFSFLRGLVSLRTLHVESNFDYAMLKHVNLHTFTARGFDASQLQCLETQTGLQSLRLVQMAPNLFDPVYVLATLLPNWPELHTLDVFYIPSLMDTQRFPVCPSVKCLKIDFCKSISDEKLQLLMTSFPNVEVFSAAFTRISDAGVLCLPVNLRDLNLRGCNITDAALPVIKGMRSLTSLDVAYTGIQHMLTLPRSLTSLDVSGCTQTCVDSARNLLRQKRMHFKIRNTFSIY